MINKHIIIVELENSHDECIYSQVLFLTTAQHKVSLILSAHAYENTKSFHHLCEHVETMKMKHGFKEHLKLSRKIKSVIKNLRADVLVFNTAQGSFIRDFALLSLFNKIKVLGVLHTTKKLSGSFTQKLISLKIKKYYLLSHILSDQLTQKQRRKIQVFYPLFFHHPILPKEFDQDNFKIVIPGGVESRRKDIRGFLDALKNKEIPQHWKIIFAGKTDPSSALFLELQSLIHEQNWTERFQFYFDFIPQQDFFKIIESAHLLLPLIHPETPSSEEYMNRQISGTFNLAYGFRVPMLIHEKYKVHEEFQTSSLFYSLSNVYTVLVEVDSKRNLIEEKRNTIQSADLFQFKNQKIQYLKWID